jgi:hypothetical protein
VSRLVVFAIVLSGCDLLFQLDHVSAVAAPTLIAELASFTASDPWLSPDGRTMVFVSAGDLYITTR